MKLARKMVVERGEEIYVYIYKERERGEDRGERTLWRKIEQEEGPGGRVSRRHRR